ncbi:MAG: transposase [Bacteroidota bacterium]|nr:transposase [Bacteroidota bacterium]
MHFTPNEIYHVYNRGNNKQPIFFNDKNYIFFLKKIREEWRDYCEILCYCLMPNHFHFLIVPNEKACDNIFLGDKLTHIQNLSKTIGKTLSSYTKAINIQNETTGNLFQKKTKAKCLSEIQISQNKFSARDYALTCFHYIHQNPLAANLIKELNEWKYSSYMDFYGYRNGTLCNKNLAMQLLSLSPADFNEANKFLDKEIIKELF